MSGDRLVCTPEDPGTPIQVTYTGILEIEDAFDLSICIALITPLASIPQIWNVWMGETNGVSLITWSWLGISSLVWTIYGLNLRDPRLIIQKGSDMVARFAVVAGILWKGGHL
ncbi:MAG: hypothetical protein HC924_01335 [Synechococcaceae cyanobacterium SM2_3_2]|nr:hypothetical protein [Synechococcaceae cyanobacterium SM2_3_2]